MLKIVNAVVEELDKVIELFDKRISWMKDNNINQWNSRKYLEIYDYNYFLELINNKELYIAYDEDTIVGSLAILKQANRWQDSVPALYIHHFVSAIDVPNVGRELIDFVVSAAKDSNIDTVRLDCQKNNRELNNYYVNKGFYYVDSFVEGDYIGNKYEMKI
ncbi:MAG: GNAT family N-acetyltransferase [Erysipelotrichales bacterium]